MLFKEQCRNVVLFVLSSTEKSELCYHELHRNNERRREQLLGLFLFLFQSKHAWTLLFFLLIKLLERGAGLTGPCLAGRQRVNGPKLNRRHLWAALSYCFPPPRIFSGQPPLSRWPVQWEKCHSEKPQSRPQRAALQNEDFTALSRIRTLPRFHGWFSPLLIIRLPELMFVYSSYPKSEKYFRIWFVAYIFRDTAHFKAIN